MEEKILQELQGIKKELQDIHSILEPKKINVKLITNSEITQCDTNNLIIKDN